MSDEPTNELRGEKFKGNFTMAPNEFFDGHTGLSPRAKYFMLYFVSRPPNWNFKISHLRTITSAGKTAVESTLQELEKAGYLTRKQLRDEQGQFCGQRFNYTLDPDQQETDVVRLSEAGEPSAGERGGHNKTKSSKEFISSAHTREAKASKSADCGEDEYTTGAFERQRHYYQNVLDLPELPDADRMEHGEFQQLWRDTTGRRIDVFGDDAAAVDAICKTFKPNTIRDAVEHVARPGVDDPWSYLTNLLTKTARSMSTETKKDEAPKHPRHGLPPYLQARIEQDND